MLQAKPPAPTLVREYPYVQEMDVRFIISNTDGMELTEIEAFVAIAEHGTFTRAAAVLGISQPAISRRITLLESDIGAPVFDRLRQGALLTDAGRVFLPHAQSVLSRLQDGIEAVHDLDANYQGEITLAMVGTLASTPLVMGLRAYREQVPQTKLTIVTANSKRVGLLVCSGKAHLGLRYFEERGPGITCTRIGRERLVIVRARESHLVSGEVQELTTLARVPWVSFPLGVTSSGEGFAKLLESSFQRLGLAVPERIEIDGLTAQKRLIEADFGIGLLPQSAIAEELQVGTLEAVHVPGFQIDAPVCMLTRASNHQGRALRRLMTFLAAEHHGLHAAEDPDT